MENSVSSTIKIPKPQLYADKPAMIKKTHRHLPPKQWPSNFILQPFSSCHYNFTFCTVFCVQKFHVSRERITCNKIPFITILGLLHLHP